MDFPLNKTPVRLTRYSVRFFPRHNTGVQGKPSSLSASCQGKPPDVQVVNKSKHPYLQVVHEPVQADHELVNKIWRRLPPQPAVLPLQRWPIHRPDHAFQSPQRMRDYTKGEQAIVNLCDSSSSVGSAQIVLMTVAPVAWLGCTVTLFPSRQGLVVSIIDTPLV